MNKYAYGIFGQIIAQDEQVENPFKYVGAFGVTDEGNGLYYMRARYYDPEAGRFISKDPIGLAGGINMYGYVGGNPMNWIDPLGLFSPGDAMYGRYMQNVAEDALNSYYDFYRKVGPCRYYCNAASFVPCTTIGLGLSTVSFPAGLLGGSLCRGTALITCEAICGDSSCPSNDDPAFEWYLQGGL